MAIPIVAGVVVGALKASLKRAAMVAATDIAKQGIKAGAKAAGSATKAALSEQNLARIAKESMTDANAALLNRLKTKPSEALYKYTAQQLKADTADVRRLVKMFKPTPKMKEAAKGKTFTRFATKALKKQLDLPKQPRIVDIYRRAKESIAKDDRAKNKKEKRDFNADIRAKIKQIEDGLHKKINGVSSAEDEFKSKITDRRLNTKLLKQSGFRMTADYDEDALLMLDDVLDHLDDDLDYYISGSNQELVLIEVAPHQWEKFAKKTVIAYIDDIKAKINVALS